MLAGHLTHVLKLISKTQMKSRDKAPADEKAQPLRGNM
jgi:hypothetical protein